MRLNINTLLMYATLFTLTILALVCNGCNDLYRQSGCYKCRYSWEIVYPHTTMYSETQGCFPLCEKCWQDLGNGQRRLPYYKTLYDRWKKQTPNLNRDWKQIEKAVLEGK